MIKTRAEAEAHQRKHGFILTDEAKGVPPSCLPPQVLTRARPRQMTRPEKEYALLLQAQKQNGEIVRYEFEGIRLKWGIDPETGLAMYYKPDFYVILPTTEHWQNKVIEVKGPWISERDMVRFKGCRAWWPQILFEMHQRDKDGRWTRIQ